MTVNICCVHLKCVEDKTIKTIIEGEYPVVTQWTFPNLKYDISQFIFAIEEKKTFQRSTPLEKLFWKRYKKSVDLKVIIRFTYKWRQQKNVVIWCHSICQFDWPDVLYFQAKFVKERVKAGKVVVDEQKMPRSYDTF